jgi:hypothetical protein
MLLGMLTWHGRLALALGLVAVLVLATARSSATQPAASNQLRWFKGNTHTHTLNSDGDSTPDDVVRWYREHGYQFLVLTDHNYLTSVEGLNAVHGAADQFLVIRGEEVTMTASGKPLHVNGLDLASVVPPAIGTAVVPVLQQAVDGIRRAGGVPHINHPNFGWAISVDQLRQVEHTRLFEIFNGHPLVNNLGGGGAPGLEEMWDRLLSSGRLMYGLAVDDAHTFKRPGDASVPGPGRGWIFVRAAQLTPRDVVEAIERGAFYASTGVELSTLEITSGTIEVAVKPDNTSRYRIQFIGTGGRVLSEQSTPSAAYTIKGTEGYVRVKVLESNGRLAWTQPVPAGPDAPK